MTVIDSGATTWVDGVPRVPYTSTPADGQPASGFRRQRSIFLSHIDTNSEAREA